MRFAKCVVCAALSATACASSAFAGFRVTATRASTANGLDRWDIVAVNTGGATGTQIKGLEYYFRSWSSAGAVFLVDDTDEDGTPDTVNLLSVSRTRIRVSTTGANNVFVGVSPTNGYAQPNPYLANATAFSGAIANLGTTHATGTGFTVARIFMPSFLAATQSPTFGFDFYGRIGGDKGPALPFSIMDTAGPVVVSPIADANVHFAPGDPALKPFGVSVFLNYGYPFFPEDPLSLSVGDVPSGVRINSIVAGEFAGQFTINGAVSQQTIGQSLLIPITGHRGPYAQESYFFVVVTPEPASALLLCGLARRRRRDGPGISGMKR